MSDVTDIALEEIIAKLREIAPAIKAEGVTKLAVFGSRVHKLNASRGIVRRPTSALNFSGEPNRYNCNEYFVTDRAHGHTIRIRSLCSYLVSDRHRARGIAWNV
jgi:hypothetical protein